MKRFAEATTVLLLVAALLSPAASAQERTPSPQELWKAYPLDAQHTPRAAATATPRPPAPEAESGTRTALVAIGAFVLLALGGGLLLRRRGRRPSAPPLPEPEVAPRRFDWRNYPPPARPAPPAPPVPSRSSEPSSPRK